MDHNAPEIYGHRISLVAFSVAWVSDPSSEQQYCADDPGLCDIRLRLCVDRRLARTTSVQDVLYDDSDLCSRILACPDTRPSGGTVRDISICTEYCRVIRASVSTRRTTYYGYGIAMEMNMD